MHDCRQTKEKLIDLVFDELQASERPGLFAEVEDCADCFGEYRLMSETLSVFNEANEAARPAESYWPKYQHTLRHLIVTADDVQPRIESVPFWKRLFATKIPVPLAAAAAIVLVMSTVLVMRSRAVEVSRGTKPASSGERPQEIIKTVEVPVYKDRIVTRTVYVDRSNRIVARTQSAPEQSPNNAVAQSGGATSKKSPGVSLEGFQPTDEVKLRIIKGSYPDEK